MYNTSMNLFQIENSDAAIDVYWVRCYLVVYVCIN